jgi:hypothetical protein
MSAACTDEAPFLIGGASVGGDVGGPVVAPAAPTPTANAKTKESSDRIDKYMVRKSIKEEEKTTVERRMT